MTGQINEFLSASDLERWRDCRKDEATKFGIHDLRLPSGWKRRSQQGRVEVHTTLTL